MTTRRLGGSALLVGLCVVSLHAGPPPDEAFRTTAASPYYRVFLKDGTSIVSYGEMARIADRVVFTMPTSASVDNPELQLVDIPSLGVDWTRTDNYVESTRAARYFATRAEMDFAHLSADIELALNDVVLTENPRKRLEIVEKARKQLAEWPSAHYGYKQADVREMLALMDEAILDLRAASGASQFELSLTTTALAPVKVLEPLLPLPSAQESIEQTLAVAALTNSPAGRLSLLMVAKAAINRDRDKLTPDWAVRTGATTSAAIAREVETDRVYQTLSDRMLNLASARAHAADVKGISALLPEIDVRDAAAGKARPDTVAALVAAVQEQLDAARRLKLARDRWALRLPELRAYYTSVDASVQQLLRLRSALEDIKILAGPTPEELNAILHTVVQVQRATTVLVPPEELRETHSLLLSATELAESAAKLRRQAALSGDMARAWDASSAAAGALMLSARAQAELQAALRIPQLPR